MYPGTLVNWYDQSEIRTDTAASDIDNKALFMVVSSFDKGPVKLMEVEGSEFNELFGKMSFEKHGQNAIQAQRIIDAGGRLLVHRVCAPDATIANLILSAKVKTEESQKVDEEGNKLFLDASGSETTEETDNPIMQNATTISWEASSVENCTSFQEVKERALELLDEENGVFPVIIFADNGPGVSTKAIRIIPDYNTSKGIGKMFYSAAVFEGTASTETKSITLDPVVIYSNTAYGLEPETMTQVDGQVIEEVYDAYVSKIATSLGITVEEARNYDLIYGYTAKGGVIDGLSVDAEGVDLNTSYGIELKGGSNGEFGDKPVGTSAWTEAMRKVWAGEITDEVWDVDQHKLFAVCDANLPQTVKDAISEFVNFRKDCVFFRDYGLNLDSFLKIKVQHEKNSIKSRFIADYVTSYDIRDPLTKRRIKVTMIYDLVECLVNHYDAGAHNPLAGTINRFILRNAIKGTTSYTPIVTPAVNQKQAMEDLRVNYAIFEEEDCVVQTLYTSQEPYTQLTYLNNVLAMQDVVRAVRTACPKQRYSLISGTDMTSYAKAVNNVLAKFAGNFDSLQFEYTQDPLKATQKIFYASIYFKFHMWAQTEIFDLFALNND